MNRFIPGGPRRHSSAMPRRGNACPAATARCRARSQNRGNCRTTWKKSIFKTTGLFDVAFKRNQDDEFHYRAKSLGFKIYQHPDIKLYYHPRSNFSLLFSQYYQYGLYKPLVLQKVKSALSIRHLIPAGFILYLLSLPLYFILPFYLGLLPLMFYLLGDIFFTSRANKPISEMLAIMLVYPTLHISYGLGFIKGIIKKP